FQLWCRQDTLGQLEVALRTGLFSQISGSAELAKLKQRGFASLCEKYGVGESIRAAGERTVALSRDFIDELLAEPEPIGHEVDGEVDEWPSPRACARAREP